MNEPKSAREADTLLESIIDRLGAHYPKMNEDEVLKAAINTRPGAPVWEVKKIMEHTARFTDLLAKNGI